MNLAATLWIIGILLLSAALMGKAIKIMGNELPALAARFARIGLAIVGAVSLGLGGVVYLAEPARETYTTPAPSSKVDPPIVKPSAPDVSDRANVIAAWHLDEGGGPVASDTSVNANHGTLTGPRSPIWIDGVDGSTGLRFAGDAYVEVPWSVALEPRALSAQIWVRADASPGRWVYILSKGADECEGASYAFYTGADGGLQFYVSSDGEHFRSPDVGPRIWDGKWHRIVGVYGRSKIRLYVDGKEVGTGTTAPFPIEYDLPTSQDLYIGSYPGTCLGTFSGDIDQVILWDTPLTPYEIAGKKIQ